MAIVTTLTHKVNNFLSINENKKRGENTPFYADL